MTHKQVYLHLYGAWVDVLDEDDAIIYAKDIDGVTVWVYKDGQEQVRWME